MDMSLVRLTDMTVRGVPLSLCGFPPLPCHSASPTPKLLYLRHTSFALLPPPFRSSSPSLLLCFIIQLSNYRHDTSLLVLLFLYLLQKKKYWAWIFKHLSLPKQLNSETCLLKAADYLHPFTTTRASPKSLKHPWFLTKIKDDLFRNRESVRVSLKEDWSALICLSDLCAEDELLYYSQYVSASQ